MNDHSYMRSGYIPLYRAVVGSWIWWEPSVLYTMLAIAIEADPITGEAMIGKAALRGRVPFGPREIDDALAQLAAPNPESRCQDHEGRTIEVIPGGYRVLNIERWRDPAAMRKIRDRDRKRKARETARADAVRGRSADGPRMVQGQPEGRSKQTQRVTNPPLSKDRPRTVLGQSDGAAPDSDKPNPRSDKPSLVRGRSADGPRTCPTDDRRELITPLLPSSDRNGVGANDAPQGEGGGGGNKPDIGVRGSPDAAGATESTGRPPRASGGADRPPSRGSEAPAKRQAQARPEPPPQIPEPDEQDEILREVHAAEDEHESRDSLASYWALCEARDRYSAENPDGRAHWHTVPDHPNPAEHRMFESITARGGTERLVAVMRWVWERMDAGQPPGVLAERPEFATSVFSGQGKIYQGLAALHDREQAKGQRGERRWGTYRGDDTPADECVGADAFVLASESAGFGRREAE